MMMRLMTMVMAIVMMTMKLTEMIVMTVMQKVEVMRDRGDEQKMMAV